MATKTASVSGDWNAGATWGGSVPEDGDAIVVNTGITVTITAEPVLAGFVSVTLNGTGKIVIAAGVTVDEIPTGWTINTNGGTINILDGPAGIVTTNNGTIVLNDGGTVINNAGTILAMTSGTVADNKVTTGVVYATGGTVSLNNGTVYLGSILASVVVNGAGTGTVQVGPAVAGGMLDV